MLKIIPDHRVRFQTNEATNSDVKEDVTKQLKYALKRKAREEKQNMKDKTEVASVHLHLRI